jgi:hypothetical protein
VALSTNLAPTDRGSSTRVGCPCTVRLLLGSPNTLSQVEGFREDLRLDAILLGPRKSGQRLDKLLASAGDNAVHQVAVEVVEPGRVQEVDLALSPVEARIPWL